MHGLDSRKNLVSVIFSILKLEISLVNDYHEHPLSYISLERRKNPFEKLFCKKGKIPPWGKNFEKLQFYENAVLMRNLDSGQKIRRI